MIFHHWQVNHEKNNLHCLFSEIFAIEKVLVRFN
jgi:hypothetical protein